MMTELYIYPVDSGKPLFTRALVQISTKTVDKHVEKHPLDMREASIDAGFNNLHIARAAC
jgi:hypothetical protein